MAECISNPRSRNNISDSNAEDFIFKQVDIKVCYTKILKQY